MGIRATLALATLSLALLHTQAFAAVGRTKGSFALSPSGSAQYSIPLWTPPGIGKLQEQLALVYNSQGGNGLVGVGWQIAGLSAIRRCNLTVAQDSVMGSPQLATNDRLCLDGKRLRLTSSETLSTYGAAGTTYQTEIADFSNITAQSSAGNGPAYFTVQARNGLTYEYGNTTDSRILANGGALASATTWALDKITDRSGNSIHFVYTNDTAHNTYRISDIYYPYTSAGGPYYDIHFTYAARPTNDILTHYVVGYAATETQRLTEIDIELQASGWQIEKKYTLAYGVGTTNRSQLQTITECSASDCLSPTTIGYQNATAGIGSEVSTGQTVPDVAGGFMMDMNGDGIADFVYPNASTGTYYVMFGSATGLQAPVNTNASSTNYANALPIDFNSDGKMDILIPNSSGDWRILESTGTSFTVIDTTVAATGAGGNAWVADVDGDGRPDIIYSPNPSSTGSTLMVLYNTGSNNKYSFSGAPVQVYQLGSDEQFVKSSGDAAFFGYTTQLRFADFDGDGRSDIVVKYKLNLGEGVYAKGMRALLSRGTSYVLGYEFGVSSGGFETPVIGDFNGDGYSDILYAPFLENYAMLYGTGTGLVAGTGSTNISYNSTAVMALDWDGDGRTDIVYEAYNGTADHWYYALSTGTGFAAGVDTGIASTSVLPFVADINGDGLADLVYPDASNVIKDRLHSGITGDLATSIADGYGNSVSPNYFPAQK
jgi:hypothetical protein